MKFCIINVLLLITAVITVESLSSGRESISTPETIKSTLFPNHKFRYGCGFSDDDYDQTDYSDFDYLTGWLGSRMRFSPKISDMINASIFSNQQIVFYAYITPFTARTLAGLYDCNDQEHLTINLCTDGANFIRVNRSKLVEQYTFNAKKIADAYGPSALTATPIFLMEPDFIQYYMNGGGYEQNGGPLSGDYMRALMDDYVAAVKRHLPSALFSWDISPWISQEKMNTWWGFFKNATYFSYINTNGGQVIYLSIF
jgi:hypothetical protein